MITDFSIWILVKLLFLVAIFIYMIFATVVVRQVYIMTSTVHVGFEVPLRLIAWLHLFLVAGVLLLALVVL